VLSSNISRTIFLILRNSCVKQNHFTNNYGGNAHNFYNVSCMSTWFFSVVITKSEQAVPLVVAQGITVKFLANENKIPAEILTRLRAQFGDKTISRSQVYGWSKSFKEGWTELENMRRLKPYARKVTTSVFLGDFKSSYSSVFRQSNNLWTNHYIEFLKVPVKPAFRSKRRGWSVKASVSSTTSRVPTPPLWQQEHWRKCVGRYCYTSPIVLT